MAEPEIRYTTTADGVSIAYYTMGEGLPIVVTSNIWGSHLLLGRNFSRPFYERLERHHTVVRYNGRGSGLSQRTSPDFSLSCRLLDLEAVVEHVGLERFALLGVQHGGLAAVAYAARHPERVTHLILLNAYASGRDFLAASPSLRAKTMLRPSTPAEWEFYTLLFATEANRSDPERGKEQAALLRASMEPDATLAFRDGMVELDVTDLLRQIRIPALVLCRPSPEEAQPEMSQMLASRIPGASLVHLAPWAGGVDEERQRVIGEFLGDVAPGDQADGEPGAAAAPPRGRKASASRTIIYTDVVGNTDILQRLGDDAWREVLRDHERITREALQAHGGTEVKTMGDGFMASFDSATSAVECAIDLQRSFAARNHTAAEPMLVRVGLNAGEPIEEDDDLFGTAVTMAARIMGQGGGGEILVSEVVRALVAGKNFLFGDRGEFVPKGFDEGVRLWDVRWQP